MAKYLVIVESPAKAKTIRKFLGSTYQVTASEGHVRDLPKSQMGVDIEHDFEPHYITIRGKGELVASLKEAAKKADKVYLATDPDREGEAISWHLCYALGLEGGQIHRITFNEITKSAVKAAIRQPRAIDQGLVDAQQARRVLDRIVGYEISPVLWKKVRKGLSAGRVQSAGLRLLADREKQIADFVPKKYFTVEAECLAGGQKIPLLAHVTAFQGEKLELSDPQQAEKICEEVRKEAAAKVSAVKRSRRTRKSPDAFTTSTLQQDASRRLNFSVSKTMSLAQQLYEGVEISGRGQVGLITYLRTDSVRISQEMQQTAAAYIAENFGRDYVGASGTFTVKGRIQDAHEAIRPTDLSLDPKTAEASLSRDQYRLYKLIYERFLASRMAPAQYDTQKVVLTAGEYTLEASGSVLAFPGFMKVYQDPEKEEDHGIEGIEEGMVLTFSRVETHAHETQPPARYTEGLLVRAMEENGVGRPSTYAPTIATLISRGYVTREKKLLYMTELGQLVHQILEQYFPSINDIGFTADMENQLDSVETGETAWKQVVRDFYKDFEPQVRKAESELEKVKIEDQVTDVICEKCGRHMVLKMGRYGKFYACPGFPECRNTKPYFEKIGVTCPQCGGDVLIRKTKKGRTYYGCSNYPACNFMSWDRPTGEVCPRCGSRLYQKNGTHVKLVCLKEGCGYSRLAETQEPADLSET